MAEVCHTIYDLNDSLQTIKITTGFILDTVRKDLLAFETRINVVTVAFAVGAFIIGVYGMNLLNELESEPAAFYRVLGGSACLTVGLIVVGMARLLVYRRIQLTRPRKPTSP
ncbi:unnamed protein product [Rotaria magnacalcarata]|uniref:Magnesium transporter MRS2 homolog, mitochondrial n=1 Tax=Rotaria magnacalcarata TaxID=392030 RepID=A0A816SAQ5_9BILA|nr:unnamed protein product [Rotaria magnacalcarata]CAF2102964.1 unnamed protein product [Rotaria magnacalcarata]CAF4265599.1 unnamed protein product [Rotaria magnacalcarata]CAF4289062.1 unnamed protein product [Rotaria magnacalcarata]